ncbi:hypothetical protein [Chitiniphilus shinanonensis]|uniref:hypothetical protein n=1 Tax=Chitiniphilus shinanonensis TaxID=553088 RepID=UPI00306CD051
MAIIKKAGRQHVASAEVIITAAGLVSGQAYHAIDTLQGTEIIGGEVVVVTPFNSATTDVIDIGAGATGSRYLNDGNIHAAGRVPLVPTGYRHAGGEPITVTWVGTGAAPTAGEVRLVIQYIEQDREHFTIG